VKKPPDGAGDEPSFHIAGKGEGGHYAKAYLPTEMLEIRIKLHGD
jgi:hypothetical protein